ncbi:helix-turn-helix domain-containing protein [Bradyrhizobium sp. 191]|uniref:helix-turn-helix domain-containing protein n=1 Tax=Bradyrhizobium sp. 191 TaxID=2782659 RepID=UPI0032090477
MRQQACRIGKCNGIIAQQGYLDFRTGRPVLSETDTDARNDRDVLDRSIDVLISRLRRKLAERGANHIFKTVRNGGYQLAAKVTYLDQHS